MSTQTVTVQRVDRARMQRWLPLLDAWLLPDEVYSVDHTWPQLYRSDGGGAFFVALDGDRLLSHCACRTATLLDGGAERTICLLGSVATDPEHRGQGLAGQVLRSAIAAFEDDVDGFVLWAERPGLYARHGFAPTGDDTCLMLARRPRRDAPNVRLATFDDHPHLHALHEQKPRHVVRSPRTMSTLLTTPGMTTVVLERDDAPVAYACTGKGADLHGHWHELGGDDDDVAALLPAAMHLADQVEAALLLPPYRSRLRALLEDQVIGEMQVPGPMWRPGTAGTASPQSCWIDGLDSV